MAYRDELNAAYARITALDAECARLRREIGQPPTRPRGASVRQVFWRGFTDRFRCGFRDTVFAIIFTIVGALIGGGALVAAYVWLIGTGLLIWPDADASIPWPMWLRAVSAAQPIIYLSLYGTVRAAFGAWRDVKKAKQSFDGR